MPYLCVRDRGLIESIYFAATYRQDHPDEQAVVVDSDEPSVAYTAKGHLCLFCPSLNHFALLTKVGASAIEEPGTLKSSITRVKAAVAATPLPAAANGQVHSRHVPEKLAGDTPDLQMRRIFVAFQAAGIPDPSGPAGRSSSLQFSWNGTSYFYGPDQQLRPASSG